MAKSSSGRAMTPAVEAARVAGIAFEILEALGDAPDYHALPVGNAGNISAHWTGYSEAVGIQTAACAWCEGRCTYLGKALAKRRPGEITVATPSAGSINHMAIELFHSATGTRSPITWSSERACSARAAISRNRSAL